MALLHVRGTERFLSNIEHKEQLWLKLAIVTVTENQHHLDKSKNKLSVVLKTFYYFSIMRSLSQNKSSLGIAVDEGQLSIVLTV